MKSTRRTHFSLALVVTAVTVVAMAASAFAQDYTGTDPMNPSYTGKLTATAPTGTFSFEPVPGTLTIRVKSRSRKLVVKISDVSNLSTTPAKVIVTKKAGRDGDVTIKIPVSAFRYEAEVSSRKAIKKSIPFTVKASYRAYQFPPITGPTTTLPAPVTTQAPTTTAAPTTTKAPVTTVAPTTTKAPVTTVAPTTTKAPVTTVAPTTTKAPVTTVAPTTTKAPVTTQAPTTTKTPTTTRPPTDGELIQPDILIDGEDVPVLVNTPTTIAPTTTKAPVTTLAPTTTKAPVTTAPATTVPPSTGAFPDASTTGVPAGTVLTPSGSLTINTAGTVIDSLDINGTVNINANNVTIKRSRITSNQWRIVLLKDGLTGVRIEDSDIKGVNTTEGAQTIHGAGTFLRNDLSGVSDGIDVTGPSTIQDNYIHDLGGSGAPHYDGIQIGGGVKDIVVRHNTVINQFGQTSAVMVVNDFGAINNVVIDNNRLIGGGYTVYSRADNGSAKVQGVVFTNNRLGKGYYGYVSVVGNTVVWSGNVDDKTGKTVNQ